MQQHITCLYHSAAFDIRPSYIRVQWYWYRGQSLWYCHHDRVIASVHPVAAPSGWRPSHQLNRLRP